VSEVLVGTCSWAEKTLIQSGEFYPAHVKSAEDRLRFYADRFRTVEVDSTYYAIPSLRTVMLWSLRTPERFVFHIKAYGALTGHGIDPKTLPADLRDTLSSKESSKSSRLYIKDPLLIEEIFKRFKESLNPLKDSGKLGLLVLQYPPWFRYSTKSLNEILRANALLEGFHLAVEFRHGSWLIGKRAGEVLRFLRDNRIAYITADEPQFGTPDTIPYIPEATTDIAYLRLHGRNRENWLKKGVETSLRYDYFYSDKEIEGFIQDVKKLSDRTQKTFVMFNNCHGASAVKNALRMMELLRTGS